MLYILYIFQRLKSNAFSNKFVYTRDDFSVRREVDLMKMTKLNAYLMRIFGKIELLSIHAT